MDDRLALMAAVIANPDEDTPRLALADWLQEHGDKHDQARADFVRAQITDARGGKDAREARRHAAALHKAHARRWMGALWEPAKSTRYRAFTRGILDLLSTTAGNFLKKPYQATVCEGFPLLGVNRLELSESTTRPELVANSPALAWVVRFIWIDAKLKDDGFAALAKSPHTSRLTALLIDKPSCSNAGLKAFAKSKSYPNLRIFGLPDGLWNASFTAAGIRAVVESERFPLLAELDLSGAHRNGVTHRTLFNFKSLSRLRVLRLGFDQDVKSLAACKHLTNLEELYLSESTMTNEEARTLVDNHAFARLKVVSLTDMNLYTAPLGLKAEQALRDRFGDGLTLTYSMLCHQ